MLRAGGPTRRQVRYKTQAESRRPYHTAIAIQSTGGEHVALQDGKYDTKHKLRAGGPTIRQSRYQTHAESRRPFQTTIAIQSTGGEHVALQDGRHDTKHRQTADPTRRQAR